MIYSFLLCAGGGTRFDLTNPKSLFLIGGKEMFLHTLSIFLKVKKIDEHYLVVDKSNKIIFEEILKREKIKNVTVLLGSSVSRHNSLSSAFTQVPLKNEDVIITHDCARVNITKDIIEKNIEITKKYKFASTQIPLVDSVFEKKNNLYKTKSRKGLFLIQTPQTFTYSLWKQTKVKSKNITDLFSYLNLKVKEKNIVKGNVKNYKITYKEDLF